MKDHDLEQSKSIIDRVLVGGALGHFGMEVSVDVIKKLIDKVLTWRNKAKQEVELCRESPSEVADYVLPELAYELSYIEASCSHASVAAIAPLFERLFSVAANRFRSACENDPKKTDHHRRVAIDDIYWNPKAYVKKGEINLNNFVDGHRQLLAAIGFPTAMREQSGRLKALFTYRNRALHHGHDWPSDVYKNFVNQENDVWKELFDYDSSDDDTMQFPISLSDSFIKDLLDDIEPIAESLRGIERHLKSK